MSLLKLRKASETLSNTLLQDKFVSHKESLDLLKKSKSQLPKSKLEYLRAFIHPLGLILYFKLRKLTNNFEDTRNNHNESFIKLELERTVDFFSHIEFGLDDQQRRAVVANEDSALIIAGAGSGKTTTMVGKVKYLTERLGVDPYSILPISFTRKSAESLKERINTPGVEPQTFHKFGLTALQSVERRKPDIFDESNSRNLFKSFLEELSNDHEYLASLTNFFINYIKIPKSQFDFESLGDYIQYLKDQNYTTYKKVPIPHRGRETFRNETVKSIEECMIANFLIFNRINYDYEKPYEFPFHQLGRKKSYKPDFTLENGIYLEHFGVDKEGNVPPFFAGPNESIYEATRSYQRSMEWKRRTHNSNGTTLLESYSYQFMDGTLIDDLVQSLEIAGVEMDPMTPTEIWDLIQESGKDEVDGFIELCQTFLSLLKSNDVNIEELPEKISETDESDFIKTRALEFIHLFEPILEMYELHLKENKMIDFNDMISRATEYIQNGDYLCPLKYVIIDEFQDLSFGRYKILLAIKKQNPDVRFYCVGDDWQSIYRFAGSDISLFKNFEDYFGYTFKAKIETTYRFNDPLISTSSDFILKNPNQTPKTLKAPSSFPDTYHSIIESEGFDNDDTDALIQALEELQEDGLNPESEVYLIGRYNFDIKRIQNRTRDFVISFSNGTLKYKFKKGKYAGKQLLIQFVTAHRSKGLEADYVIIINCNSGKYGFPSGKADDPILNLLLSSADQFENGEERRLFYVAMTRTKRHVVFITDRYRKSKFIKELQDEDGGREKSCPKCKSGELILRSGKASGRFFKFYGCSNFAYGCDYSKSIKAETEISSITSVGLTKRSGIDLPESSHPISKPESSPVIRSKVVAPVRASSTLTRSEKNRLDMFVSSPYGYSYSQKGVSKVKFLESIEHKFNAEEQNKYLKAHELWASKIRNRFDA
jgi:DNA helicase-4